MKKEAVLIIGLRDNFKDNLNRKLSVFNFDGISDIEVEVCDVRNVEIGDTATLYLYSLYEEKISEHLQDCVAQQLQDYGILIAFEGE